ncbi:hypothetical protein Echvi_2330 [Echinicola vietnamensis DSM 17526]|uniref:Uncharacterized protein n=1 Tax=Echinicola vietnamensis (strain DSM 17526 / LMG 23754 / KMM 6221) TaxID=926556 RepID=L0FZY3_ECHVK|nr:hypothetical protein Echvi_2330 [Echinicola vietnamensis DSM 17526]
MLFDYPFLLMLFFEIHICYLRFHNLDISVYLV